MTFFALQFVPPSTSLPPSPVRVPRLLRCPSSTSHRVHRMMVSQSDPPSSSIAAVLCDESFFCPARAPLSEKWSPTQASYNAPVCDRFALSRSVWPPWGENEPHSSRGGRKNLRECLSRPPLRSLDDARDILLNVVTLTGIILRLRLPLLPLSMPCCAARCCLLHQIEAY